MSANIVDESWFYFDKLNKIMNCGTKNVATLNKLFMDIKATYAQFAKQMQSISENFHIEISKETDESEPLIICYQFLSNYILKTAQSHYSFSNNIQTEIIEPFQLVMGNFKETNQEIRNRANIFMKTFDQAKAQVKKVQEGYYRLKSKEEKSSEMIEKVMRKIEKADSAGLELELQKTTNNSVKIKMEAEEAMSAYKLTINQVNKKWETFDNEFLKMFEDFDFNNESRISFSKFSVSRLVKLITTLYKTDGQLNMTYEEKLREQEDKFSNFPKGGGVIKQITKGQPISFLNVLKKEEFVPYETWKRLMEGSINYLKSEAEGEYIILSDPIKAVDKKMMELAIHCLSDPKQYLSEFFSALKAEIPELSSGEEIPESKERKYELSSRLSSMFGSSFHRKYFMDLIIGKLKERPYLSLSEEKFYFFVEIMADFIKYLTKDRDIDAESFQSLLTISSRVYKSSNKITNEYLSNHLNELSYWEDKNRWENFLVHLLDKKLAEEKKKAPIPSPSSAGSSNVPFFKKWNLKNQMIKGLKKVGKTIGVMDDEAESESEIHKFSEKDIKYAALEELNYYLINLGLKWDIASEIIIELATKEDVDKNFVMKLLEKQENKKFSDMRKSLITINQKKPLQTFKKINEKWGSLFGIRKALEYLDPNEDKVINLLLVCKKWKEKLERKVMKFYLIDNSGKYKNFKDKRIAIWKSILLPDRIQTDYEEMKKLIEGNEKLKSVEDVINLDVQRSLYLHKEHISANILKNLLRAYAQFNPEVSYCQGMNYLAGFLYLNIKDEATTFKCMISLISMYMENLFTKDLAKLKILFFQFDRCLYLFAPELAEHLKNERIDSSYYATAWFITIFSSVFQYTLSSHLLINIWDIFLTEGWKGLFKVCIVILKANEARFLDMAFDDILNTLTDLGKSEIFLVPDEESKLTNLKDEMKFITNLKSEIKKVKINNSLMNHLECEYDKVIIKVNQKLNDYKKNK